MTSLRRRGRDFLGLRPPLTASVARPAGDNTADDRGRSATLTGAPERPPAAAPRPRANRLLGFALELRRNQLRTYERAMRQ
jgi:hypothetical protein